MIEATREQDPNYKPSTDASLSELTVEGVSLSPAFSSTVTDYIVYVPFETKTVKLAATANDSKAHGIGGTGEVAIEKEGDNALVVTCTAEDRVTKRSTPSMSSGCRSIPARCLLYPSRSLRLSLNLNRSRRFPCSRSR